MTVFSLATYLVAAAVSSGLADSWEWGRPANAAAVQQEQQQSRQQTLSSFGDDLDALAAAEVAAALSADDLLAGVRELSHSKHKGESVTNAPYTPPMDNRVPLAAPPMSPAMMAAQVVDFRQELACAEGYDLKGNNCVANELVAPDLTCLPGKKMYDGKCAVFTRGRRNCPDDMRVSGSRCISSEIVPAELTCTEGELDETGTSCRIFNDAGAQCPAGFRYEGNGMCSQQFPAQVACPPGHLMSRNGCVREVGEEARPMCPLGSELEGGRCFTLQPGKAKCPKGFKQSHQTGSCVKKARKDLAACPPGFTESSTNRAICERMLSIPPQLTCPPGAVLDSATGHCHTENIGAARCPDGYTASRTQASMCERMVEEVGLCPPGTVAVGYGADLRCQTAIEHDIIECCPPGFERMLGRCQRHEIFAAVSKCQGDCARVRVMAPVLRCPEGFRQDGRRCFRMSGVACPELTPVCEPFAAALQGGSGSLRRLDATQQQMPAGCEANLRAVELCRTMESIPADLACPAGDFDGTNCVIAEVNELAQEKVCNFGSLDPLSGQCVKVTSVPVKTECPLGTLRVGRTCLEHEDHTPDYVCPEGAVSDRVGGGCIMRAPALNAGVDVIKSAPIPVCAAGTLQGTLCYDVERVPRQFVCPEGAVPANRYAEDPAISLTSPDEANRYCVQLSDTSMTSPQKKYVRPQKYCSDGTPAKGSHCKSKERSEPLISCPPGSDMDGQLCTRRVSAATGGSRVTTVQAVPICPVGTTVQGTKCVATREMAVAVKCPPGFEPQVGVVDMDKECVQFSELVPMCPQGSMHTPNGCLRERLTAPILKAATVTGCEGLYCA